LRRVRLRSDNGAGCSRGVEVVKVYTIKLPRFLGGIVKAVLSTFTKDE